MGAAARAAIEQDEHRCRIAGTTPEGRILYGLKTLAVGDAGLYSETNQLMKTLFALLAVLTLNVAAWAQATAEDLKKHMAALKAVITSGTSAEAAKMSMALLPDGARLKKALADGAPADAPTKIAAFFARFTKTPEQQARLLFSPPERTEIQVHAATTEEIAKFAPSSVVSQEFPGGAKDLAANGVLRPGVTFYEVEFLEPGKTSGTKFHLFYHDGTGWAMLGPVWQALK
jgi:hypothetical protein